MFAVVEIAMLVIGCGMLITGKFHFKSIHIEGETARWVGICLVAPMLLGFIFGFVVGLLRSRFSASAYFNIMSMVTSLETISIIGFGIAAAYLIRNDSDPVEKLKSSPSTSTFANDSVPSILTSYEAANYLRISEPELINFINAGQIAAVKVNDGWRIARQTLDDFVAQK